MSGVRTETVDSRLSLRESSDVLAINDDGPVNLQIHVQFITGRAVAARVDAREQPEWPPHPGRVYMALAAAHFETDSAEEEKLAERQALDWLAELPPPRIRFAEPSERTPVSCYVPVNDSPQPNKAMLQSALGMPRSRQSRTFPTVIPLHRESSAENLAHVSYQWQYASGSRKHLPAIERLCRQVIRVGHSSSLVMAWADTTQPDDAEDWWEPAEASAELTCRVAAPGELERLRNACQADRIELFAALKAGIDSTKGKAQTAVKKRFAETFGETYKASVRPPEPVPATLGVWQGYRRAGADVVQTVHENTYFERDLLILAQLDGPTLNVERTLGLTQALRAALIASHGDTAIPAWLCGHDPDGTPTSTPHAAFLGLPFVGHRHADGHLLGLAIAMPKGISVHERGRWLGPLLVDQATGEAAKPQLRPMLKLWGPNLPDWTLQLEERPSPPLSLQNTTWTRSATTWASVTPVVLDRFPKASRGEDRQAWHTEVVETIRLACARAGLPEPLEVDVDSTAWHAGVPRAWAKGRRMRGTADSAFAPLGDGFPAMPAKTSRPTRPQVHVWLRFDQLVRGPVLLGAGRFLGYGLCKPVKTRGEEVDR